MSQPKKASEGNKNFNAPTLEPHANGRIHHAARTRKALSRRRGVACQTIPFAAGPTPFTKAKFSNSLPRHGEVSCRLTSAHVLDRPSRTLARAAFTLPLRHFVPERLLEELNRQYLVECDGRVGNGVHHVPGALLPTLPAADGVPLRKTSRRKESRLKGETYKESHRAEARKIDGRTERQREGEKRVEIELLLLLGSRKGCPRAAM